MRDRPTARVLLFDSSGRLALMRGRTPGDPNAPSVWFSVGGGIEAGETILEAAAREVVEETGFGDVELETVVWYREVVLPGLDGEPLLFKESYVLGRCCGGDFSRAGWQDLEHDFVDDLRWWSAEDIRAATDEIFYPEGLADLLDELMREASPREPRVLGRVAVDPA